MADGAVLLRGVPGGFNNRHVRAGFPAAHLAARVQPKLLIVNHVGLLGRTAEDLIAGIRRGGFTGRVVVGNDLDRY